MRRAVLGVFDRQETARAAIAALARSGFDREHIHVAESRPHATAAVVAAPPVQAGRGALRYLSHLLADAYGGAPGTAPAGSGGAVISVDIDRRALAARAELALVTAGAVDITHQSLP